MKTREEAIVFFEGVIQELRAGAPLLSIFNRVAQFVHTSEESQMSAVERIFEVQTSPDRWRRIPSIRDLKRGMTFRVFNPAPGGSKGGLVTVDGHYIFEAAADPVEAVVGSGVYSVQVVQGIPDILSTAPEGSAPAHPSPLVRSMLARGHQGEGSYDELDEG